MASKIKGLVREIIEANIRKRVTANGRICDNCVEYPDCEEYVRRLDGLKTCSIKKPSQRLSSAALRDIREAMGWWAGVCGNFQKKDGLAESDNATAVSGLSLPGLIQERVARLATTRVPLMPLQACQDCLKHDGCEMRTSATELAKGPGFVGIGPGGVAKGPEAITAMIAQSCQDFEKKE